MSSRYRTTSTLHFEQGIPVYSVEAELLEEYLDRVATLEQAYPEEVVKKNGPFGPRLYSALRGEANLAARSKGIDANGHHFALPRCSRLGERQNIRNK